MKKVGIGVPISKTIQKKGGEDCKVIEYLQFSTKRNPVVINAQNRTHLFVCDFMHWRVTNDLRVTYHKIVLFSMLKLANWTSIMHLLRIFFFSKIVSLCHCAGKNEQMSVLRSSVLSIHNQSYFYTKFKMLFNFIIKFPSLSRTDLVAIYTVFNQVAL